MKYAILTFGCRANQADSFAIARRLRADGGEEATIESADLVVVNTCAVTATAEQGARQAIRRVGRVNPSARIVATGCYAARDPSALRLLPVHAVLPTARDSVVAPDFSPAMSEALPRRSSSYLGSAFTSTEPVPRPVASMPGPGTFGRTIYLLKVQTGCNEACAYCVVPSTRGPSQSVEMDAVLREVSQAADAGFKQLMLTGVHLGSYGRDLTPARSLADLVAALADCPADVTFRLSAVEPMDVDTSLADAVARNGRFAPHFHLPLQHGSNAMLRAMRRPYPVEAYARTVDSLRARFPDAALGTDVIVGFPGETERDFDECCRYLAGSPLTYVHVFPFSPRPGTTAAMLGHRPIGIDVRERIRQLRAIGADAARRFRSRFVARELEGLTIDDGCVVLTDNYLRVKIAPGLQRNERVRVRITGDGEEATVAAIVRPDQWGGSLDPSSRRSQA